MDDSSKESEPDLQPPSELAKIDLADIKSEGSFALPIRFRFRTSAINGGLIYSFDRYHTNRQKMRLAILITVHIIQLENVITTEFNLHPPQAHHV